MPSKEALGLIDSHAHIQGAEFAQDLGAVFQRAHDAGVEKIIVVGGAGDLSSNDRAIELAESSPEFFATVGMHPHDAKSVGDGDLKRLKELTRNPKVVAIGETGLDFYYEHSPRQVQIGLFCRFIQLALETGLPLVVHNREAEREVASLLKQEGKGKVRGVIHCFTGDYEAASEFLDLGFYLSFAGIITFKNAGPLRDVVRKIPLDCVLVETDSPYLAPVPHRGKRNEPAFVRIVAETVASVRGVSMAELAQATSLNARKLFGI